MSAPPAIAAGGENAAPIRVLHCIHSLSGGGAERQLNLLIRDGNWTRVQHGVFCVRREGKLFDEQVAPIFQATRASKWNFGLVRDLKEAMRAFRPTLVHAWLPASMTMPTLLAARSLGIPCIFSYRSRMFFHRPLSIPEWLIALLFCDRVLSNTPLENCTWPYRLLYRRKQGSYIPNCVVGKPVDAAALRRKDRWQRAEILFVGRLTKAKNIECLLRGVALLRDVDWRLRICGGGELEAPLHALSKELGLGERVVWLGHRTDVPQLMRDSDVLVLSSWYEGLPNVVLEAMMQGLPVLASRIPATHVLLNDVGRSLMFDPAQPAELALSLRELITNDQLRHELSDSLTANLGRFSTERIVGEYERFYTQFAAARRVTTPRRAGLHEPDVGLQRDS